MEYAQLLAYAIQGIRAAIKALKAGSAVRLHLEMVDAKITLMQAEGRNPSEAERAQLIEALELLAQQPAQGA
jgi:precorrin isomerase